MKKNGERNLKKRLSYIVSCILVVSFVTSSIPSVFVKAEEYTEETITQFSESEVEGYDATKIGFDYKVTKIPTANETGEVMITGIELPYQSKISIPDYVKAYGNTYKVTAIGEEAFWTVEADEIYIPDTVKTIAYGAFKQTTAKKIRLSSNIENISGNPFSHCRRLETIELDNANQYYYSDGKFLYTKDGKTLITTVNFQESVTIKEGVENVLDNALSNCCFFIGDETCNMLQKVTYPSTVKTIGEGNTNFYLFVFKGKNPPKIKGNASDVQYALVPKGCIKKYQSIEYEGRKVFDKYKIKDEMEYYSKNKKFIEKLNYKKYTKATNKDIIRESKKITKNTKNDKEKALYIYKYVVENYCVDESSYSDSTRLKKDKLATVFKNKIGSGNGINNVTVELFRAAGIPAVNVSLLEKDGTYNDNFVIVLAYIDKNWHIVCPYGSVLKVYVNGQKSSAPGCQYKYITFYEDFQLQSLLADFNYVIY